MCTLRGVLFDFVRLQLGKQHRDHTPDAALGRVDAAFFDARCRHGVCNVHPASALVLGAPHLHWRFPAGGRRLPQPYRNHGVLEAARRAAGDLGRAAGLLVQRHPPPSDLHWPRRRPQRRARRRCGSRSWCFEYHPLLFGQPRGQRLDLCSPVFLRALLEKTRDDTAQRQPRLHYGGLRRRVLIDGGSLLGDLLLFVFLRAFRGQRGRGRLAAALQPPLRPHLPALAGLGPGGRAVEGEVHLICAGGGGPDDVHPLIGAATQAHRPGQRCLSPFLIKPGGEEEAP
mmetsp:Transcript_35446/g.91541  ORF Transcript_35446/g.91541 Transcript_35446/m.91541 type:complete len:285 (+) Transcript_35446:516-1370(+)